MTDPRDVIDLGKPKIGVIEKYPLPSSEKLSPIQQNTRSGKHLEEQKKIEEAM